MQKLIQQLQRRNVFRVAGIYAVVGWLLVQMSGALENAVGLPEWFDGFVVSLLLIGFPIAMIFAWAFEMTPEGVKRTETSADDQGAAQAANSKLDYVIMGGLALVAVLIVGDRMVPKASVVAEAPVIAGAGDFEGQSIAVLPFEDFSPNQDQAYFADGIAEELLNVLARVDGLRVASRTSAFSFKGGEATISEIAAALNVDHILEGSVRKAGDTLRITAQLIDAKTDEHLWSETYDRPLTAENIFEIQDEISQAIVLELNGRLDLLPEMDDRPTQSTEAYEAYLKGKEAYALRTPEGVETGITELIRAVTLDPNFAVAHSKLGRAYRLAEEYTGMSHAHASARSEVHIDRSLMLAPNDWDVLTEYAWALILRDEISIDEQITAFDAAIAANPNNAEAHRGRGFAFLQVGRLDEALVSQKRARVLDPRSGIILMNMTASASARDDIDEIEALMIDAITIDPDLLMSRNLLAYVAKMRGDVGLAHRIVQSCSQEVACRDEMGRLYVSVGMYDEAEDLDDFSTDIELAFAKGHLDVLEGIAVEMVDYFPENAVMLFVTIGRTDEAYAVFQKHEAKFAYLLDEFPNQGLDYSYIEFALLDVFEHAGDPRAQVVRTALARKFEGASPNNHFDPVVFIQGAMWRMEEDDPDGAMDWLNALADRDVPAVGFYYPQLQPLKTRPDYIEWRPRMDTQAARHRAIIEAQLANPPEVWWSPEELLANTP